MQNKDDPLPSTQKKDNERSLSNGLQRQDALITLEAISNLISPFVDDRHVDIVNEN